MSTPYPYPTALTDAQWQRQSPFLPSRRGRRGRRGGPGGLPRPLRLVFNVLYRAKTGCPWPMLPPTFGP